MLVEIKGKKRGRRNQKIETLLRHEFVERAFYTDSREPFSFVGREYLIPIYDDERR